MSRPFQDAPVLSVVIPIFNEEENLHELHLRLMKSLEATASSFEIVLVEVKGRPLYIAEDSSHHRDPARAAVAGAPSRIVRELAARPKMDSVDGRGHRR